MSILGSYRIRNSLVQAQLAFQLEAVFESIGEAGVDATAAEKEQLCGVLEQVADRYSTNRKWVEQIDCDKAMETRLERLFDILRFRELPRYSFDGAGKARDFPKQNKNSIKSLMKQIAPKTIRDGIEDLKKSREGSAERDAPNRS